MSERGSWRSNLLEIFVSDRLPILYSSLQTYKFDAVLGGSEEVLADLGIRQALR